MLAAAVLFLAAGCAPARHRLAGEEARGAEELFAAAAPSHPIEASYSGVLLFPGRALPFVAGVNSRTPAQETVGFYDPQGRAVLILANDGATITLSRGPAAGALGPEDLPPVPAEGASLPAGRVSLGRILFGAPGYAVEGGVAWRTADGGWVLENGRQTLFSDPLRRVLSRAEYEISGKRVTVAYPGRESPGPPATVTVEIPGAKIVLRRDAE